MARISYLEKLYDLLDDMYVVKRKSYNCNPTINQTIALMNEALVINNKTCYIELIEDVNTKNNTNINLLETRIIPRIDREIEELEEDEDDDD